jgi:hypothetical protein|uniref:Uncharacterized protein n=1 Tax=viral metagenome TaxID=1070528 RepID=A0A6C0K7K0_9ZZZZ
MRGVIEGFDTSPALEDVFTSVLKIPKASITKSVNVPGTSSKQGVPTKGAACPATSGLPVRAVIQSTASLKNISPYTPTPFLKTLINNEKKGVESLLRVAAKIGPVAHTVVEKEKAYDAAFQSKIPAPIPTYGSTLQGFAFILFFWSYIALAIVMTVFTNGTTGTMIGFAVAGVLIFTLIKRFG